VSIDIVAPPTKNGDRKLRIAAACMAPFHLLSLLSIFGGKKEKKKNAGDLDVQSGRRFVLPQVLPQVNRPRAGAKMSRPPPGLQRKNAMDADAKAVTIKVTLWIV
jgi:hypothetical protein